LPARLFLAIKASDRIPGSSRQEAGHPNVSAGQIDASTFPGMRRLAVAVGEKAGACRSHIHAFTLEIAHAFSED
jgi:hypothetical protein